MDHAIDFLGQHWLVMIDAYSEVPVYLPNNVCLNPDYNQSSRGQFHTFRISAYYCFGQCNHFYFRSVPTVLQGERHCSPYHPATNGADERLIRTFKEALRKSSKPPKQALQEFLLMYHRTPTHCGYSPSELLNGRQIRTKIDTLIPVPLQLPLPKEIYKENSFFQSW